MWRKPCRTFHPWCPCIKTRCLLMPVVHIYVNELGYHGCLFCAKPLPKTSLTYCQLNFGYTLQQNFNHNVIIFSNGCGWKCRRGKCPFCPGFNVLNLMKFRVISGVTCSIVDHWRRELARARGQYLKIRCTFYDKTIHKNIIASGLISLEWVMKLLQHAMEYFLQYCSKFVTWDHEKVSFSNSPSLSYTKYRFKCCMTCDYMWYDIYHIDGLVQERRNSTGVTSFLHWPIDIHTCNYYKKQNKTNTSCSW